MGYTRWEEKDWATYATTSVKGKTTKEIYTSRTLDPNLDPKDVNIRESRDSDLNPTSNAIIVGLDVTGSMHSVLDSMARNGLVTLVTEIYNKKPVTDPHIMCMGIGDVEHDKAPLQVTQFEADIKIAEQLAKIYLEGGGGGNSYESYALSWYFAAMHTSIDCFEKRKKKGYLFTVGDEEPTPGLSADKIKQFLGSGPQKDLTGAEILSMASRQYDVYHLMVEEGSHFRSSGDKVVKKWTNLLGQRAIRLADHTKMAEVIVSILQLDSGVEKEEILKSWDGSTSIVVDRALGDLAKQSKPTDVVRF